ncbi:MAG TPA: preprotein translocase subunit SecG [Gemmatimonadaceae bacterium]|nr:preprotein translocase subunit SecG [Gemmatimonadaceae bacterium]HVP70182.1 preprotein translocase subunit SecG [Gemmatimonadaceae bacterium]
MFTFLLVLLIIISVILIGAVLLQSGKGSGLAASFGGASSSADSFMGTHQLATGLSKGTWYMGGIFLLIAYMLAIMSARPSVPKSILDQPASQLPAAQPTAPAQAPTNAAPVVPLQPAPTAPTPPSPPR